MDPITLADYALLSHPYKARMYQAVSQNITGSTDNIAVTYDTIDYDPAGMLSTVNHNFTAPIPGWWLVIGHVSLSWTNTAGIYFGNFNVSSGGLSLDFGRHDIGRRSQGAFSTTVGIYGISQLNLSTNDTVQFGVFHNNTTNASSRPTNTGSALTFFEVHFLRPR